METTRYSPLAISQDAALDVPTQAPMRSLDPESADNRAILYEEHPVVTRSFYIPTGPVRDAFDRAMQEIAAGGPGIAFDAFPRFGKSWAIKYLEVRLREAFPNMPIVSFHAHSARPNRNAFYGDILVQTLNGLPVRCRIDGRDQLSRALWTLCQDRSSSRLTILGDEMQRLSHVEYTWLIDLANDLQAQGVRVTSVFFGQPELRALRQVFLHTHRGDILGRFLARIYPFHGIRSALELHEIMAAYDEPNYFSFPEGSGWCFTRFFLPRAYAAGWRLASCSTDCWEQFAAAASSHIQGRAGKGQLNLGMEWVGGAIQRVLTHYRDFDRPKPAIGPKQWKAAIRDSGFRDHIGNTYDAAWGKIE